MLDSQESEFKAVMVILTWSILAMVWLGVLVVGIFEPQLFNLWVW